MNSALNCFSNRFFNRLPNRISHRILNRLNVRNAIASLPVAFALGIFAVVLVSGNACVAQQLTPLTAPSTETPTTESAAGIPAVKAEEPMQVLVKEREDALIKSVYQQTRTAKTASDFTKLIEDCRRGQTLKVSEKNQKYLQSLIGWGLNRRGGKRLDLSTELRTIRNYDSADEMLELAEADFQESLEINADNWRPKVGLAVCEAERGKYLTAIEKFTTASEAHPEQTEPWFNKAELLYSLDRFELALSAYDEVIELNPSDLQAITGRAHCLNKLGRMEEAVKEYEVVTRLLPTNNWALINLADCHQALGNWQQAYDGYFQAMKSKPIAEGYQKTAWMLATCPDFEFNRPELAFTLAKKAVELGGETVLNLETLAAAHAASDDFEAATKTLRNALVLDGGINQAFSDRIDMYENEVPFLQKSLEIDDSPEQVAELPEEN